MKLARIHLTTNSRRAGASANDRFNELARVWRRRLRPLFVVWLFAAIVLAVAGFIAAGEWRLVFGIAAGMLLGSLVWVRETPPTRIENWRWGSEGERKTAKVLRRLPSAEWQVWHDLRRENGTNIDHVVVGAVGIFLIDSKNYVGHARVDDTGLHSQMPEDPETTSVNYRIFARLAAASAELKETIEGATGVSVWVQPVAVLWGNFEQQVAQVNKVAFIQGRELDRWLLEIPPRGSFDRTKVRAFLDQAARDGLRPRPARHRQGPNSLGSR